MSAILRSGAEGPVFDSHRQVPVLIASIFREEGATGIHTHVRQLRRYLDKRGVTSEVITPYSSSPLITYPLFAPRPLLARINGPAGVAWYRHWHERSLRSALRRRLANLGECVVYAQGPLEARAALDARRGPHQQVVMAVHFRVSLSDEHAEPGREIGRDGAVFRWIRQMERDTIPRVDGIVYVSTWARDALLSWLPEAGAVPSSVITNFVDAPTARPLGSAEDTLGDMVSVGKLEDRKNHRFLLHVLAEANRAGRRLTLDVYGEGPLRRELGQLARTLGVGDQVRFRGFRADVREFLPRYRVYVHSASAESAAFPLAIIEAMAAGLPVVAADVAGISGLCDDGVDTRFWSLDDPVGAAAVLVELLDDERARSNAALAASERFYREFDATVVGPRLWSFLCHRSGATVSEVHWR